jgi:hypothetical protein
VIGQAVVGVMTGGGYTLEAGIVPCLYSEPKTYALALSYSHGSWGEVQLDPVPADPNAPRYTANTALTLMAVPMQGKGFSHWEVYDPNHPGDLLHMVRDANNPLTLLMDADREVMAVFQCGSGVEEVLPLLALAGLVMWIVRRRMA